MFIESTHNDTVKKIRSLSSKKGRLEHGMHFIEGERLVMEALASGAALAEVFAEEGHDATVRALEASGARIYAVTRRVMESLSQTDTPQWVCASVKTPDTLPPDEYPDGLIVALDCVQDPGNMGTILRTADAMGAAGLLLGGGCADPFGPKAIRSTMGSIYHLPVWQGGLAAELNRLKQNGYALICGHLNGSDTLPQPGDKCVLVIGNEGNGVSEGVAELCEKYRLPMYGKAESLNASVAAGILIYELSKAMKK